MREISPSQYLEASKRKEHEEGNLDNVIFSYLKKFLPSRAQTLGSQPVSKATSFKNDIEVRAVDLYISIEVEKGIRGRFELDLEKMHAFAHFHGDKRCFGTFIIPADNSLPRDVTGCSGESSFRYILRVGRLFIESEHGNLEDVLAIGYFLNGENYTESSLRMNDMHGRRADSSQPDSDGPTSASAVSTFVICESQRYQGKSYLYWWDISPTRRELLAKVGEIYFVKKDTGEKAVVKASKLLPLLTQARQTSRGTGNWGIKVLVEHPNELAVEQPGKDSRHWPTISVTWLSSPGLYTG